MADKNHPLLGGLFVAGGLAVIGVGAYVGVTSSQHEIESEAKDQQNRVAEEILAAIAMGQSGNIDGAVSVLRRVVQQHPDDVDANYNLGVALIGMGQLGGAEASFKRVLELQPGDVEALAELAGLAKDRDDLDAAFSYLERIPPNAGKIQLRLGQDPLWLELAADPRMAALRKKHGLPALVPTETATSSNDSNDPNDDPGVTPGTDVTER